MPKRYALRVFGCPVRLTNIRRGKRYALRVFGCPVPLRIALVLFDTPMPNSKFNLQVPDSNFDTPIPNGTFNLRIP